MKEGSEFIDLIPKEVGSITLDLIEAGLDSFLNDGLLKDIPLVGTFLNLLKVGKTIREQHLLRQIMDFLSTVASVNQKDREVYWSKISSDGNKKEEIGTKLMLLLDRMDEAKKAKWLGLAFNELVLGNISENEFYDLAYVIDNIKQHLAVNFYEYSIGYFDQPSDYLGHFVSIGLLYNRSLAKSGYGIKSQKIKLDIPNTGLVFRELVYHTSEDDIVKSHYAKIIKQLYKLKRNEISDMVQVGARKEKIEEFEAFLKSLPNRELLEIKQTSSYIIVSETEAVVPDQEYVYYFEFEGWANSGMWHNPK